MVFVAQNLYHRDHLHQLLTPSCIGGCKALGIGPNGGKSLLSGPAPAKSIFTILSNVCQERITRHERCHQVPARRKPDASRPVQHSGRTAQGAAARAAPWHAATRGSERPGAAVPYGTDPPGGQWGTSLSFAGFARHEGIVPAPEANHAVKGAIEEAMRCKREGKSETILFNLCGHGHFDMTAYQKYCAGRR